ncbi:MAG: prephenate dehydrogenase [Candidatus Omnitrophota bacterium]
MGRPLFNRVCIVGVGLIGGSLGMAIKKRRLARTVIGVVRKKSAIEKAFRRKALDAATLDLKKGVAGADLVILCGPVSVIVSQLKALSRLLDKKTIVIDVGSSKKCIGEAAKKFLKKNTFVGCHPMAGSEKSGIENARAGLFRGAVCFLASRNRVVEIFWKALGAQPVNLDARRHDQWAAKVSHLPHVLSFVLLQALERPVDKKFDLNPSFKELARLAKSRPGIWSDILLTNSEALLDALRSFRKDLDAFERGLRARGGADLVRLIAKANSNAAKIVP